MQKVFVILFFFIGFSLGQNANCALVVPTNPLTAVGLSTPFLMKPTVVAQGPCNQSNPLQSSFVQGAVIDLTTGAIHVYNPLVIDAGSQPLAAPIVPTLPASFVAALWFGTNAGTLTLLDSGGGSLVAGNCVNGISAADVFGQFAYCNAVAFFNAANSLVKAGKLVVPPLGTGYDGLTCMTVRDFAVVDMDQSDNVVTTYLLVGTRTAQLTAANLAAFANPTIEFNGSDNRLLAVALDGALGCTPWMAPDLADPGNSLPALPLNELQAAYDQSTPGIPQALVPAFDPMTTTNGVPNLKKMNLYRVGVNQNNATSLTQDVTANTTLYCKNIIAIAPKRIFTDRQFTILKGSPDGGATATNLYAFLANRLSATLSATGLNCLGLLKITNPITLTLVNGIATDATFNFGLIGQSTPVVVPTTVALTSVGQTTPQVSGTNPQVSGTSAQVVTKVASASSISLQIIVILFSFVVLLF